ncbi:hypothetical protein IX332_001702 [Porphyromonas levii]|uniref:DUF1896 family protein n=1 Tax=Porphyromonas levii TaxID=28114 RepID=A0A4Y8WN92_9PORP|nr:DUF1896 family protein [Porphyromonas levii]MBR8703327.1 hypothetical protein [Porphyromonas levii]MBR8730359.1 hypothetical protein [Porphyromonas levii]MBR8764123.1 hypothetical protein [Porphyromonas levii]MBR8766477.1 hypothetical protein [Porphyromonas levii]MBR8770411.1 hypothetical protein [Porphyromonas levii]
MKTIKMKEQGKHKSRFNYYEIRLRSYLRDYFPEKLHDNAFIRERSDFASESYEQAFLQGYSPDEAHDIAMEVLFADLHFSSYYLIEQILENEFDKEIETKDLQSIALSLVKHNDIRQAIAQYTIDKDFDGSPEYDRLYTELTGLIAMLFEQRER